VFKDFCHAVSALRWGSGEVGKWGVGRWEMGDGRINKNNLLT